MYGWHGGSLKTLNSAVVPNKFGQLCLRVLKSLCAGDVGKQLTGLSDAAGTALQDASTSLDSLRDAASGAAGDLSNQALQQASSALSTLPAPLRDTIQAILNPIAQVLLFHPGPLTAFQSQLQQTTYFACQSINQSSRLSNMCCPLVQTSLIPLEERSAGSERHPGMSYIYTQGGMFEGGQVLTGDCCRHFR